MADPRNPLTSLRLATLPVAAKLTLTAFLGLIGAGYLVAVAKINVWHSEADGVAGMSPDDLRAVYHGLERTVTVEMRETLVSPMLHEVSPGGKMRKHLLKGGEPSERALIAWLKDGAKAENFDKPAFVQPQDPSARQVIAQQCVKCHNPSGDEPEIAYAPGPQSPPSYELVAVKAVSPLGPATLKDEVRRIEPTSVRELLHITHAHILSIPVFALVVAVLFLMTGLNPGFKLVVAPLPMIASCVDFACWWLARPFEPAIFGILAAGAVFGAAMGVQILCVLGSMWFGRKPGMERAYGL